MAQALAWVATPELTQRMGHGGSHQVAMAQQIPECDGAGYHLYSLWRAQPKPIINQDPTELDLGFTGFQVTFQVLYSFTVLTIWV